MTQATYSIRLDKDKKNKFDEICARLGLSASAAFSTFVNKTIEKRGLPYELTLEPTPSEYGIIEVDKLTREEIIAALQEGIDSGEGHKASEIFESMFGKE